MTRPSQPLANAKLPRPKLSAIDTRLLSPLTLPPPSLPKDVVHLLNQPQDRPSVPSFRPQPPEVRDIPFRRFHSMGPNCTLAGMRLVPDQLPLSSPPNLQAFTYASSHALSTSDFSSSTSAIHTYTEPIYHHPHTNDSWEVIHESKIFKPIIPGTYKRPKTPKASKTTKPPKSPKLPLLPITPPTPRMPILHAGSTPHLSTPHLSIPTFTAAPPVITKGYDSEGLAPRLRDLKQRITKGTQLHIRTGSLPSFAGLGSTLSSPVKQPHNLTLINVNMVVMGTQRSGVSSLIYRFINGTNGWVAPATVDDFWHHVVRSKSEERISYYNITEVTGEEEYEGLRKSMLRRAQVVVLCFRLDRKMQFKRDVKRVWPCYSLSHDCLLTWAVCSSFLTSPQLVRSQSSLLEHTTTRPREQCRTTRHATCYIAPVPLSDTYTTGLDVCSLDPSYILRVQRAPRSWGQRDLHCRSKHPTRK